MEEQTQSLLATLKKASVTVDAKLAAFNNLKSSIKHQRVPESGQAAIFECIKLAISAQTSPTLVSTGFSTLGHLIKRLSLQEQTAIITQQSPRFLPILQERLGDARESLRNAASSTLCDLWPYSKADVERVIKEGALSGHNARAKEMAMLWVVKMHNTSGLPFKGFVSQLVACLEDADGSVRETAKSTVVELFRTAPEHAKTDLKRQMTAHNVRRAIFSFIVQHLGSTGTADADLGASVMSASTASSGHFPAEPSFAESAMSEQPPLLEAATLDPLYIHTQRELEDAFRDMAPPFEGRETEFNWSVRDKSVMKIRRMLKGNAPSDFHVAFVAGIKAMLDNILKVANTLRTTMSTNGCQLVQELYKTLGTAMDPMTELFMQNFIKMSSFTKKIAAENANATVETILSNTSYNQRLMQHIWLTFQEKNVQTRSFGPQWLRVVMKKNAAHKSHVEHSGGLEIIEKCIKKGLEDANPKVRENTRHSYWVFAQIWPGPAEKFMLNVDDKLRTGLEKDPNNPNKTALSSSVSSVASARPRPAPASRASVRDAIAAQRRAAAARTLPERPNSAQSSFSPVKSTTTPRPGATRPGATRPPSALASSSTTSAGPSSAPKRTLTAAPVRPRRPELTRPATADPYATRKLTGKQSTPTISPQTSPSKSGTATKASAARAVARTPARSQMLESAGSTRGKERAVQGVRQSPQRTIPEDTSIPSSPTKQSTAVPVAQFSNYDATPNTRERKRGKTVSVDNRLPASYDEDTFTMVIPNLRGGPTGSQPSSRPSSSGNPVKSGLPRMSPHKLTGENVKPSSPLVQRMRTPAKSHSPERASRPDATESVQVYEDPFIGDEAPSTPVAPGKPVLEEIPLNQRLSDTESREGFTTEMSQSTRSNEQNMTARGTPRGHHKTTSTGSILGANGDSGMMQASAETLRSRQLLVSGIGRIRAKTLDAHGFRRVQDIIKGNQDIWGEDSQRYGELLLAMLDYLEAPADVLRTPGSAAAKIQNLKTQVLATVRAMLALHKKEAEPYYSRSLCSILATRAQFDEMSHITAELEKAVQEIVRNANPSECLNAVLDLIDTLSDPPQSPSSAPNSPSTSPRPHSPPLSGPGTESSRTITTSLTTLASLLGAAQTRSTQITSQQTKRLGELAVRLLQDEDPEVRRADLEFCLELHEKLGGENGEGFWKAVAGARESNLNLITYYLARRGKA